MADFPEFLAKAAVGGGGPPQADPLERLVQTIDEELRAPRVGVLASQAMSKCFEQTAEAIEKVCQEAVDRAIAIQVEARAHVARLRQEGELLCAKIEGESARLRQISLVHDRLRELLAPKPES